VLVVFDLRRWKAVEINDFRDRGVEAAVFTRVVKLRKTNPSDDSQQANLFRARFQTGGFGVWPYPSDEGDRVRYQIVTAGSPSTEGSQATQVWELVKDIRDLGTDGVPFELVIHAVYWNGFQEQQLGGEYDWAGKRVSEPTGYADLTIRLPAEKTCTDAWTETRSNEDPRKRLINRASMTDDLKDCEAGYLFRRIQEPLPALYMIFWKWQ
jgi:hypothetical protein